MQMKANPFLVDSMKQAVHKFEVCSPGEFAICEREQVAMADIVLSGVNKEKADILHVMRTAAAWVCIQSNPVPS